jgi:peptide/nickel transport system permease protein
MGLGVYTLKRLLASIPVLFIVTLTVFAVLHMAPGDPALIMAGPQDATPEVLAQIRKDWGLNDPLPVQYLHWVGRMAHGDFGSSMAYNKMPIIDLLKVSVPKTLNLNLAVIGFGLLVAIPAGVIAATHQYSLLDNVVSFFSLLGISMPNFWLALMMMILFSATLHWLPLAGATTWKHYIMPTIALGSSFAGGMAQIIRSSVLEALSNDYVRTARAKGLAERAVLFKHVLKNAAIPIVTYLGFRFAFLMSGLVVVETVFAWPGMGRLAAEALFRRDYFVVQATVLIGAVTVIAANIIVDLLYGALDPRIRYQ